MESQHLLSLSSPALTLGKSEEGGQSNSGFGQSHSPSFKLFWCVCCVILGKSFSLSVVQVLHL